MSKGGLMSKKLEDIISNVFAGEWGDDVGLVSVIRTTNFTNHGQIDFSDVVERNIADKLVTRKKLLPGDVIIEKSGGTPKNPVGRVVFFDSPGVYVCNNFTSVLRPNGDYVHAKYLFYFLFYGNRAGMMGNYQNRTTGIINLQLARFLKEVEIPLPPLAEQERIAAILDAADAHRQKTKALLEKYDQLAQSIFLEMFGDSVTNDRGWEISKIDDISTKVTDGEHLTPKREPSGYFLLSARNVQNGYIDFTNVDYVGEEEFERISRRCNPEKGDLLISCSGSIGRVTSIRVDAPFVLVRSAALVKPDSAVVNVRYLEFYLRTPYIQALMLKTANASSQANLFTGQIKEIPVLLPPLNEQNLFSERIKVLDEMIESTQSLCLKSESLFQSLLQGAFSGKMA